MPRPAVEVEFIVTEEEAQRLAGLEIVCSLARLDAGEARAAALSRLLQRHPDHAVRMAVDKPAI